MTNEELVRTFFATLSAGDLEGVRGFFDEDSTWFIVATGIPGAGEHRGADAIVDGFLAPVRGLFEPGQPKVEIVRLVGDGDLVAVEATGRGRFLDGRDVRQPVRLLDRDRRRQDQDDQGVHGLELRGGAGAVIAPPEPDLTPAEIVARAHALRPLLVEQQAETEARTYYSEEVHEEFLRAGFYRMLVPRRFGGYEFDLPTFMRVIIEIAAGCPSTAWCLCLSAAHALQVGALFEEKAQAAIFGDRRLPVRRRGGAGGDGDTARRRLGAQQHPSVLVGGALLDALHGPDVPATGRARDTAGDPALRRAPRPVDDAGRLGRHARAQGQRVAQRPARAGAHPGGLRAREHVDGRHGREQRDTGLPPARQPDVRGPHAQLLPVRAHVGDGRCSQGRAGGVRGDAADAKDAAAADRRALPRSRLPALVRSRDGARRGGGGDADPGRRAVHGDLPAHGGDRRAVHAARTT